MTKHMIPFGSTQDGERELIDLAFSKKKADDRKEWLRQFRVRSRILLYVHLFIAHCSPGRTSITIRTRFRILISSTRSSFFSPWPTTFARSQALLMASSLVKGK
jgi:hypothetical protein